MAGVIGALVLMTACTDNFLTGGDLSTDPNRPTVATSGQLFVGIQANVWAQLTSDPARLAALWSQQLKGGGIQTIASYNYDITDQTTNGFHQSLYTGGGLVDLRRLEEQTSAAHDSVFLGIAQVMEGLLMGTGADMFGKLTYTEALSNQLNPSLDSQLAIYDSVQTLLDRAIVNLAATGPTNAGPGPADLSYGGDPAAWTKLAHTLKARFLSHTAEVRTNVWPQVLAQANQGLQTNADDYNAVFSGNANEQNFWYQFGVVQRAGYLIPDPQFVALLVSRNDPRISAYFNADTTDLNDSLYASDHTQPLIKAAQNVLLAAEAAARTGDNATALADLNRGRQLAGGGPEPANLNGNSLLAEILYEEYIADFQTLEVMQLYNRTCTPNLTPTVTSGYTQGKVPARFPYDAAESNTNVNVPILGDQPLRNENDPKNATSDATGQACKGQ
jgi:hypothetical protein